MKHENIYKLTLTALMAALSYVIFTFLQIQITLPGGDATSFHLGNAVCVLGALLVGGVYGGIGGAIGMTIGDLFNPVYVVYAPKTFILKFCIGLITGLIAHKIGHISTSNDNKHVLKWTIIATVCGLGFNVVFDPLFGYFYKRVLMGKPAAAESGSVPSVNGCLKIKAFLLKEFKRTTRIGAIHKMLITVNASVQIQLCFA